MVKAEAPAEEKEVKEEEAPAEKKGEKADEKEEAPADEKGEETAGQETAVVKEEEEAGEEEALWQDEVAEPGSESLELVHVGLLAVRVEVRVLPHDLPPSLRGLPVVGEPQMVRVLRCVVELLHPLVRIDGQALLRGARTILGLLRFNRGNFTNLLLWGLKILSTGDRPPADKLLETAPQGHLEPK